MPGAWSDKDERRFEDITKSEKKAGRGELAAEEIACPNRQQAATGRGTHAEQEHPGQGQPSLQARGSDPRRPLQQGEEC